MLFGYIIVKIVNNYMTSEFNIPLSESLRNPSPEIVVLPSCSEVDKKAFDIVSRVISEKPNAVLTLATGSSPVGLYQLMTLAYDEGRLDLSNVTTRNLDEYWPLSKENPQSYSRFMKDNLFDHVNIPEENRNIPDCEAVDPEAEVSRYQSVLKRTGASDLTILGIGPGLTCHIAFNERGSCENSRTRLVKIDPDTVKANARFFDGDESKVPQTAITQGIADILESRKIILIAKGFSKAEGIRRTLEGPIGSDAPASFLRNHPDVTFILDKEAASLLGTNVDGFVRSLLQENDSLMCAGNCRNSISEINKQIKNKFPGVDTKILAYPDASVGMGVHYSLLVIGKGMNTIVNPVSAPGFPEYVGEASSAPPMFSQMRPVSEVI